MKPAPQHPYRELPASSFWRKSVAGADGLVDPIVATKVTIGPGDKVASAGSCFAQHVARHLLATGANFLMTEGVPDADAPVFSARFGNIYSVRQLAQTFARAYGTFRPADAAWRRQDGRFIDPFRPQLFPEGFASVDDLIAERRRHFAAVRTMFEQCSVFIFTLGLTETWLAADGAAVPLAPGVVATEVAADGYVFHNFGVAEMLKEMADFLKDLKTVNPDVRLILTVSPVPLVATYENRHVLVSNTYSKAALRVVAEETARAHSWIDYFPSYEIVTAPQAAARFFAPDLRSITADGVAHVMAVFDRHFRTAVASHDAATETASPAPPQTIPLSAEDEERLRTVSAILCDEQRLKSP